MPLSWFYNAWNTFLIGFVGYNVWTGVQDPLEWPLTGIIFIFGVATAVCFAMSLVFAYLHKNHRNEWNMKKCVYNVNVLFMCAFTIAVTMDLLMSKETLCDLLTRKELVSDEDCDAAKEWGSATDYGIYLIVPVWLYAC